MRLPGEALLDKLWSALGTGFVVLVEPWQIRRKGRAETDVLVEAKLRIAQAEMDVRAIQKGRLRVGTRGETYFLAPAPMDDEVGDLVLQSVTDRTPQRLVTAAAAAVVAEELRRDINVSKAVLAAEGELRQEPPGHAASGDDNVTPQGADSAAPDADWLYRWRDAASEVSSESLQQMWGRVLAGEVRGPGTFSLRTLAFLRNVSQKDADDIEKLSRYVVNRFVFRGDLAFLDAEGLDFDFIQRMSDLGILAGLTLGVETVISSTPIEPPQPRYVTLLRAKLRALLVTHLDSTRKITIPTYAVTELGVEVCRLTTAAPSEEYLHILGCTIERMGYDVGIADFEEREGGKFRLSNVRQFDCARPAPESGKT